MKKIYLFLLLSSLATRAQVEWTGSPVTFSKAPNADWNLEANQDRITSNVWITRKNNQGLFNIVQETAYQNGGNISPVDTEWAFGNISDGVSTLTFTTWDTAHGGSGGGGPQGLVDQDMVIHLISDDIYVNIKMLSWGQGGAGGGSFSYERSTENLSVNQFNNTPKIRVFPNPAINKIQLSGLSGSENYIIYNILGREVLNGSITNQETINVQDLAMGSYFLKLNDVTLKFVKR